MFHTVLSPDEQTHLALSEYLADLDKRNRQLEREERVMASAIRLPAERTRGSLKRTTFQHVPVPATAPPHNSTGSAPRIDPHDPVGYAPLTRPTVTSTRSAREVEGMELKLAKVLCVQEEAKRIKEVEEDKREAQLRVSEREEEERRMEEGEERRLKKRAKRGWALEQEAALKSFERAQVERAMEESKREKSKREVSKREE